MNTQVFYASEIVRQRQGEVAADFPGARSTVRPARLWPRARWRRNRSADARAARSAPQPETGS
jgi:hypothetical protein